MADELTKPKIETMKRLLAELHGLRERETLILEEMDVLVGGGVGIGELLKQAERAFAAAWSTRYPGNYIWRYAIDRPNTKRLVKQLGLDELTARFTRYVRNDDKFFRDARHSFGAFVATVNQHAGESEAPADLTLEAPPPADCRCHPRCTSDQEHTRRRAAEMRRPH